MSPDYLAIERPKWLAFLETNVNLHLGQMFQYCSISVITTKEVQWVEPEALRIKVMSILRYAWIDCFLQFCIVDDFACFKSRKSLCSKRIQAMVFLCMGRPIGLLEFLKMQSVWVPSLVKKTSAFILRHPIRGWFQGWLDKDIALIEEDSPLQWSSSTLEALSVSSWTSN